MITLNYATSANFAMTLASLASSPTGGWESTAIDNGSDLALDAIVQVGVKLAAGSPANDKAVYLYAYGAEGGTTYTDNCTGTSAAITLRTPTALVVLDVIPTPDTGGLLYESQPISVAAAFGGWLPRKWGIVIRNYSGLAFTSTEGDHFYKYTLTKLATA